MGLLSVVRGWRVGLGCGGVVVGLLVVGCGGSGSGGAVPGGGSSGSGSGGGPLVINAAVAPATLDPPSDQCGFEDEWDVNLYRQLIRVGRKPGPYANTSVQDPAKFESDVAKSWSESSNGLVYTFHLDPSAKFNDGTPITSQAVKFTYDRAIKLKSCGESFWAAEGDPSNLSLSTPNATTLVVRLKKPNQLLLGAWAFPGPTSIQEPKVVQEHPDAAGQAVNPYWADHIAGGGGPFVLDSYSAGTQLVMSKNPAYTGPTPAHVQKVIANFGLSESTLLLQARSGAADVTFGLNPGDLSSLESDSSLRVLKFPVQEFYDIGLTNTVAPFTNAKVREALAYAVPYAQILKNVLYGYGSSYYGPLVPTLPFFNPKLSAPLPYDLAKAKALLASSGVKLPLKVTLVLQQGAQVPAQIGTAVQATWKQIGVDVTLDTLGSSAYNDTVEGQKAQAFIRVDGPGVSDEGWLLGYDMECKALGNNSAICIPQADKLLAQAETTTDKAKQQQLYDQITTLWRSHYPKIIVAGIDNGIVLSQSITHFDAPVIAPEAVAGISK
jgi:peptide/nickel transport system substrate-binding protein